MCARKYVGGKVYDTAKSKLIGCWDTDCDDGLDYVVESLYRTPGGRYYIHGEGGARTHYGKPIGCDSFAPGEAIVPMTRAEAAAWAAAHLPLDTAEAEFGPCLEA